MSKAVGLVELIVILSAASDGYDAVKNIASVTATTQNEARFIGSPPRKSNLAARLFFLILFERVRARFQAQAGRFGQRYPAVVRGRRFLVDLIADPPHLEVKFDAPAVGHGGLQMHIVMRPAAAV